MNINSFPTHEYQGFRLRVGQTMPFGATLVPGGVNFSVYSNNASACRLVLYHRGAREPLATIPFFEEFRIGYVFSMIVYGLDYENVEYGYQFDGPNDFKAGHWFQSDKVLLDPYAKLITGRNVWGQQPDWDVPFQYRGMVAQEDFDWEGDRPLQIDMKDLIVYEMHVRGFTAHPSSGVKHRGTFAGLREKIPYLKELGVNCVELMPIYEFDEFENSRPSPATGETLMNYWGYGTIGFFAPKAGLAATGRLNMQVDEFKALVRDLHRNGIEVILDVVFNHTAEGNERGPYISFRGIDNKTYYMLTPDGYYYNFSGCGNTLNCNHPVVRTMILDCLRYWASSYHIDGFRFDLATILGRNQDGSPMQNPPLLENLAYDPVLGKCKLIAEAWDAGGLYQVGTFPNFGRWAEWNGKYRDEMRRFLKGEGGLAWNVAQMMSGSPHIYDPLFRGNAASVNFICCHDGFTLMDLFCYNEKQNFANGEDNRDGGDDNFSWNCGAHGETGDEGVNSLRRRMVRNALALLLTSRGVPMLLAGDEFGNSQQGNNNAYCQDNELSWLNWDDLARNQDIQRFARALIQLRHEHPCLKGLEAPHLPTKTGYPKISYHGVFPWLADYSDGSRLLGVLFAEALEHKDDFVYVLVNAHWESQSCQLPGLPEGYRWHLALNTDAPDIAPCPIEGMQVTVGARSVLILTGDTQN